MAAISASSGPNRYRLLPRAPTFEDFVNQILIAVSACAESSKRGDLRQCIASTPGIDCEVFDEAKLQQDAEHGIA